MRRRARGLAAQSVAALAARAFALAAVALAALVIGACGSSKSIASSSAEGPRSSSGRPPGRGKATGAGTVDRTAETGGAGLGTAGASPIDGLVTPAQAARRVAGGASVPILMYHVIKAPPATAKFPGLYVPEEEFAEQMQALARAGYRAVTMDQLLANWTHGTPLPPGKPVVLSFDNGYLSQLTDAEPVLQRLGWVGVENLQLSGLPPSQGGLSRGQVAQLIADGWELDTQGVSHADLIAISPSQLRQQVFLAREELQHRYHVPVNWFCYPSGHYDQAVVEVVKAAGFVGSTTVVPGWAAPSQDPYRLPRLRVLGGTTGAELVGEIAAIRSNPPPPNTYSGA